jgi:hypothetical protein
MWPLEGSVSAPPAGGPSARARPVRLGLAQALDQALELADHGGEALAQRGRERRRRLEERGQQRHRQFHPGGAQVGRGEHDGLGDRLAVSTWQATAVHGASFSLGVGTRPPAPPSARGAGADQSGEDSTGRGGGGGQRPQTLPGGC